MSFSEVLSSLAYAGIGAAVGSIGAAFVSTRAGKNESRAHAADMLANGYGGFADRLEKSNEKLDKDNKELRASVVALTVVVDLLIPYISGAPTDVLEQAKRITRQARLSL